MAETTETSKEKELHDIVVLSDLHLGRGKNVDTGRFYSLETFFYDEDLRNFCSYVCEDASSRGTSVKLVLNGDVFDLLRIEPEDAPAATTTTIRLGTFGPVLNPIRAARMVEQIMAGHGGFIDGLAQLLEAGHEVVFLPGNHDIEIQWAPVQDAVRGVVRDRIRERSGDAVAESSIARLRFEPWFVYEPGRVWIEHGCQYDSEGSFKFQLRSGLVDSTNAVHEAEQDLPLGNFFQRYLYNAFGAVTFIVPSTRANVRYFYWLLFNKPALLARVAASHGPFLLQLLRRLARTTGKARRELKKNHERELQVLSERSGLGEKLHQIDELKKVHPIMAAIREISREVLKFILIFIVAGVLGLGLWFAGFHAINQMKVEWDFILKPLLFLGLSFFMLTIGAIAIIYSLLRRPPDVHPGPLRVAAQQIVEILDVPLVTFGHSHEEVLWTLRGPTGKRAWYYNTGTWIAVFTHNALMPRERVQFTFLRIRGKRGDLLQWSPGRREPIPVILLDEGGEESAIPGPHPA